MMGMATRLNGLSGESKGRVFTLLGVMILSFDSLLVRLIDCDEWTLIFWRGFLPATVFLSPSGSWIKSAGGAFLPPRPSTLFTAVLFSASTICFVFSLDHTQVTSTLVLTNTAPLITAILAFIFLKEKLSVSTIVTIIISVGGIWLVFGYKPQALSLKVIRWRW